MRCREHFNSRLCFLCGKGFELHMSGAHSVQWQDHRIWLGDFEKLPDSLTQGLTYEELADKDRDLPRHLTNGEKSGFRRAGDLPLG